MPKHSYIPFVLLSLAACRQDLATGPAFKYEYFPVDIGHWVIYDADSTVYDAFLGGADTTYVFQVKEVIESSFTDNEGRTAYRIERYKRDNDSLPWVIRDVWYANRLTSRAERVEENYRYVKLTFPPGAGRKWDGNAQNALPEQEYEYTSVDVPLSVNGLSFDSTLTVKQVESFNLIAQDTAYEWYAKHVGLVYKKLKHLDTELLTGKIEGGIDYVLKVRAYGN